jgi:TRAP-type C4-dicarboxylate transport system permease small subunit
LGRAGKFLNYFGKYEDGLAFASALIVGFMMVYTVVAVITRAAGVPIKGFTEYVTLIFVFVIMLAVSYAQRRWEHLAMGVLFDRMSAKAQRRVLCVLLSLGIFICVMLTWSSIDVTVWAYLRGDVLLGAISVTTWWSRMAMPIGIGTAAVRLVIQLVQTIRGEKG